MSKYQGARFLAIDGEAVAGKYALLADSQGRSVEQLDGLPSSVCLEFLTRRLPSSASWTRVGFGLHYDVNNWFADWPQAERIKLFRGDVAVHDGWWVHYVANRILTIRRGKHVSVTIYDCLGMFRRSFVRVCEDWLGECPEIIREGKARRERFAPFELEFIREYNREECRALVRVLESVKAFLAGLPGGGVRLQRWYGAGAIAASWLRRAGARRFMRRFDADWTGPDLLDAFARAYHGGRVEARLVGTVGPVWRYDLNSAYAWAASHMGRVTFRWLPVDRFAAHPDRRMSVWRVTWNLPSGAALGPFPVRDQLGGITYPLSGSGWYWWPEVAAAREIHGARRIAVEHGYVCEDGHKPAGTARHNLGTVLRVMYQYRYLIRDEHPAGARLLKLALAAVWGKFAQHHNATNDDDPGYYFCLPWAGWITSCVRGAILKAVHRNEDAVVAISTDGIVATRELPDLAVNDNLGGWRREQFARGTFLLPGLFVLEGYDGQDRQERTRGYERAAFDWGELIDQLNRTGAGTVKVTRYIGHLLADLYPDTFEAYRGKFVTIPITVQPGAIVSKRVGGEPLTGQFRYDRDHLWLGTQEGNRAFLSCPMRENDPLAAARRRAEQDGEQDGINRRS